MPSRKRESRILVNFPAFHKRTFRLFLINKIVESGVLHDQWKYAKLVAKAS